MNGTGLYTILELKKKNSSRFLSFLKRLFSENLLFCCRILYKTFKDSPEGQTKCNNFMPYVVHFQNKEIPQNTTNEILAFFSVH